MNMSARPYGASMVGQYEIPGIKYPKPRINEVIFFSPSVNHTNEAMAMIHGTIGCKKNPPIGPRSPGGAKPTLAKVSNSIALGNNCNIAMSKPGPTNAIFLAEFKSPYGILFETSLQLLKIVTNSA